MSLKAYTILLVFLCSIVGVDYGYAQIDQGKAGSELLQNNSFGIRSFNLENVVETNFLRDSSHTYKLIENQEDPQWNLIEVNHYDYDHLGNEVSRVLRISVDGLWMNKTRWETFYGYDHEITEINELEWSGDRMDWEEKNRKVFTYNVHNNLVEELLLVRESNSWVRSEKRKLNYTPGNLISNETIYLWESQTEKWEAIERLLFTYNSDRLIETQVLQLWDDSLEAWVNESSRSFEYNQDNKVVGSIRSLWDTDLESWVNTSSMSLAYDDKGQLSSTEEQVVGDDEGEYTFSEEALYNDDGNLDEIIQKRWDDVEEEWDSFKKELNFWSVHMSGNLDQYNSDITCHFANPYLQGLPWHCDGLKSDQLYTIEVFDTWGRAFHKGVFKGSDTFRIDSNVPPGFYTVVLRGGLDVHTEKVFIRN